MKLRNFIALAGFSLLLSACPGPDYNPVYFPTGDADASGPAAPSGNIAAEPISCTLQLQANLCIALKGERVSVGNTAEGEEALCTLVDQPIPFVVRDTSIELRGDVFPDIQIDNHGLPFPITINGKGDGTGTENLGSGTINTAGEVAIDGFDLYVSGAGTTSRIPDLHFTTGTAAALPHMASFQGHPIDEHGQWSLVTSTRLSTLFTSTEDELKNAGLMLSLSGQVSPLLRDCGALSGQPQQWQAHKLITNNDGEEIAIAIPHGKHLEVSAGTYIASEPAHIGERYSASAKFQFVNISGRSVAVDLPALLPEKTKVFTLSSPAGLKQSIPADGKLILTAEFLPRKVGELKAGLIQAPLTIGSDEFDLRGIALDASGRLRIDHVDNRGNVLHPQIDQLDLGRQQLTVDTAHAYFQCDAIQCSGTTAFTNCQPCTDRTALHCSALAVDTNGAPLGAVDAQCNLRHPNSDAIQHINFAESHTAQSQLIRLRNEGTAPLTIRRINLEEAAQSQSHNNFVFDPQSIVLANQASELAQGEHVQFPITLPPYNPPLHTTQAYLNVAYIPSDLLGSNGQRAGVGATVLDHAELFIVADEHSQRLILKGSTSIKDVPPLQLHFGTEAGLKTRQDGATFAFRGITNETSELSVPVYASASGGATQQLRLISFRISGPDADAFVFLDAAEEIAAQAEATRCMAPVYDDDGNFVEAEATEQPAGLAPNGFDFTDPDAQPFFGCVSFRKPNDRPEQRQFKAELLVRTQQLGANKQPVRNADGSLRESTFTIPLTAVVDPREGHMVFRVSQTMSGIMNNSFPTIASVPSGIEIDALIASGKAVEEDRYMFLGAVILDPFDEETIYNEHGEVVTSPDDGITSVVRAMDTRPSDQTYDDPQLGNYANLYHDSSAPEGEQGIFFDFPNVPENFRTSPLRIFTSSLSYPGPTAAEHERPHQPSMCEVVNPCSTLGQRKFGDGPTEPGKVGVCAYFYTSVGAYDSPTFHYAEDTPGGTRDNLCVAPDTPQQLYDITGTFDLDGNCTFDAGLRFWGPTVFHNPSGQLGPKPVLDETWHLNLTTNVLLPPASANDINLIPSERMSIAQEEYKLNLDLFCEANTNNQTFGNKTYSAWKYFAPLMSKDPEGKVPATCNDTGHVYFHGRPLNHENGALTVVAVSKFSANPDLTFAFADVPIFIALNGWLCDPTGDPERYEGPRCYDLGQNPRDRESHISIIGGSE